MSTQQLSLTAQIVIVLLAIIIVLMLRLFVEQEKRINWYHTRYYKQPRLDRPKKRSLLYRIVLNLLTFPYFV